MTSYMDIQTRIEAAHPGSDFDAMLAKQSVYQQLLGYACNGDINLAGELVEMLDEMQAAALNDRAELARRTAWT